MAELNITSNDGANVSVQVGNITRTEITIDRGLVGPPGPNTVGGFQFAIEGLQANDVLRFGGTHWQNTPQTELADGGNF